MTISLKGNPLLFQQQPMLQPSRGSTSCGVYDPMTREFLSPRCIAQRTTHHTRMTGPTRQGGYEAIGRHATARYLTDNIQHISLKCPCLLWGHPVRIVLTRRPSLPAFEGTDTDTAFLSLIHSLHVLTSLFRFWFGQRLTGLTNKQREIIAVINIRDIKVGLSPFVWRKHIDYP